MKIVIFAHVMLWVIFSGCSDQSFSGVSARRSLDGACDSTKAVVCLPPAEKTIPEENKIITPAAVEHEAVFAVRDISCALCHAKIQSNIISDFAVKTGQDSAAQAFGHMLHLFKHGHGGPAPSISGNFIIPSGNTFAFSNGASDCVNSPGTEIYNGSIIEIPLLEKLNTCASPRINWGADSKKFITRKSIDINPVSSTEKILAIASAESVKLSNDGFVAVGNGKISGISGTKAVGFKSLDSITCEGAVVFDGPLLLKNTVINTEKGCRMYSTASIFVFGKLDVVGPAESANIQLMSTRFVGFDIDSGTAAARLTHPVNVRHVYSIGTASEISNKITLDAKLIQATTGGNSAAGYTRVAASAPVVYAKNSGIFSGVIIAEQFIGKIGSLLFNFDPIFKKSATAPKLFPEIKDNLVSVSAD